MSILNAIGLSKHFGAHDVFEGVNLQVAHGDRIGLVGANGSGKSTLLRILADLETPSAGRVYRAKGLRIGYLPQEVTLSSGEGTLMEQALAAFEPLRRQAAQLRQLEEMLAAVDDGALRNQLLEQYGQAQAAFDTAGGYTYEQRIRRVLGGLGFGESDFQRPLSQLSGGQQTRAHLAHLLLSDLDLLLLDEPTNHLDLAAVEWLEEHLLGWPGAMIIVAHDRYFLDRITTRICDLERGGLQCYRGNYSAYVLQRAERRLQQQRQYERQQEYVAREEDFIRRNIAGQRTREAQGRRKRLERLELVERVVANRSIHLDLSTDLRSGDLVLATYDLQVGYHPQRPLFTCPDVEIRRGERVALLGPNGAGKTTFVKTILRHLKPLSGRVRIGAAVQIGYFAQAHAGLNPQHTVLESIVAVRNLPLAEARDYLARFLFRGDDVFKRVADLSGGERARVALARLSMQGANFLVLDEPTNHLDIPSQEVLQSVLSEFPGTILLVSHDRFFVDALATQVWALEDGRLSVTKGGYTAYLSARQARRQSSEAVRDNNARGSQRAPRIAPASQPPPEANEAPRKRSAYRQQQALASLQQAIEQVEARLSRLADALEEASQRQEVERVAELGRDYQAAEAELARLFDEWAELEA